MDLSTLLELADTGDGETRFTRAQRLAALLDPDIEPAAWATLPIGQRDTRLLEHRQRLFGPVLPCLATCPNCGVRLEFELRTTELLAARPTIPASTIELHQGENSWTFRAPSAYDLHHVAAGKTDGFATTLLDRCLVAGTAHYPEGIIEQAEAEFEQIDPMARLEIGLSCVQCKGTWRERFDIAEYLWQEVRHFARRILHEVHVLASRYGWSERDILAMTPQRRHAYLRLGEA